MLFPSTIAGSLPKPEWLAGSNQLSAVWKMQSAELEAAKRDATLLAVKLQEDAGIDIITDGEQARRHFIYGFLEHVDGIDFANHVAKGMFKNRFKILAPQVMSPLQLKDRVHKAEANAARQHTNRYLKFTLPGPMTIVDTIADRYYGDIGKLALAFADLLNQEARGLESEGIDMIQFDEPAFNVYTEQVRDWGIEALERAAAGLNCATAVHVCYGYGIKANDDWKKALGNEWRQYEEIFPIIAKSSIQQVAVECKNSKVPLELLELLNGKIVQAGVIDVASEIVETPEDIAANVEKIIEVVPKANVSLTTNCGMAPMRREVAERKLEALGAGAKLARERLK